MTRESYHDAAIDRHPSVKLALPVEGMGRGAVGGDEEGSHYTANEFMRFVKCDDNLSKKSTWAR